MKPSLKKWKAAIALMESGFRDHAIIAKAVGLNVDQISELESATNITLRRLAANGVPEEFTHFLRSIVRCPGCGHRITIAPCVTCRFAKGRLSTDTRSTC